MFGHAFLDTLLITLRDLKRLALIHIRLIVTKVHGKTKTTTTKDCLCT